MLNAERLMLNATCVIWVQAFSIKHSAFSTYITNLFPPAPAGL